jgi:hypothetical protein
MSDFSQTTLEAAMVNTEAAVRIQVSAMNAQLVDGYKSTFNAWSLSVVAGRDAGPEPAVPFGYKLDYFPDNTNSKALWAFPALSDQLVTLRLASPPVPKPYVPAVLPEPDFIRNVPLGDMMPVGFTFTLPDGAKWQKQSSHTPFGIALFYARVA